VLFYWVQKQLLSSNNSGVGLNEYSEMLLYFGGRKRNSKTTCESSLSPPRRTDSHSVFCSPHNAEFELFFRRFEEDQRVDFT